MQGIALHAPVAPVVSLTGVAVERAVSRANVEVAHNADGQQGFVVIEVGGAVGVDGVDQPVAIVVDAVGALWASAGVGHGQTVAVAVGVVVAGGVARRRRIPIHLVDRYFGGSCGVRRPQRSGAAIAHQRRPEQAGAEANAGAHPQIVSQLPLRSPPMIALPTLSRAAALSAPSPRFYGAPLRWGRSLPGSRRGLRTGEIVALRWGQVDLERPRIHVRESVGGLLGRPDERPFRAHQGRRDRVAAALRTEGWR
jgi:hypothetical protein